MIVINENNANQLRGWVGSDGDGEIRPPNERRGDIIDNC